LVRLSSRSSNDKFTAHLHFPFGLLTAQNRNQQFHSLFAEFSLGLAESGEWRLQ
jgi:hypothetical protein